MGQLQVVARHTDTSPSSCYEPVLIPGLTTDVRGAYCWTVAVRPGISEPEFASVYSGLIPGPMDLLNLSWQYTMVSLIESQG